MSEQAAFAVPKDRQDVTVVLDNGKAVEGSVFLDYFPGEISVHQKIVAFLENENSFFPLQVKGGGTEFIQKKKIRFVELFYSTGQEKMNDSLNLMHVENVTVVFNDEAAISGALMAEVPAEKARLSDCLNLPETFLTIKADNRIWYVNKNSLRKVVYAGPRD